MPRKISQLTFLFKGNPLYSHFQYDNLGVTHVFIKRIFRTVTVAPPSPLPPTGLGRGWGFFQPQAVALVNAMKQ
jgi:hypothetical protein